MNDNLNQREKISALADGQLQDDEWASALHFAAQEEGHETWQLYHLVGDVLRSPELARQADGGAFLNRLRQQLAQEPPPVWAAQAALPPVSVPVPVVAPVQAANDPVFRWKMVAGLASLAAVAAVAWSLSGSLSITPTGSQLALAPAATAPTPVAVPSAAQASAALVVAEGQAPQIMIRDPRLDELLAAHKQFGGASALQLPAGFLRNATFESPSR
ncbi:MAG: sigma-E factor negative regulatory protein [Burkholderiaceae bacterium]|nr:sigma-E factor negative regulatory protein [Burkholderiaceae bacterium]